MIRKLSLIAIGTAALAACQQETIVAGEQPDPMKEDLAKAAPVELPPAIVSSKSYRCKDNSLVQIDWLEGGKGANLRVGGTAAPTPLRPAPPPTEGQQPVEGFVAEGGFALKGDAKTANVNLTMPGKPGQSCRG
jgi:hypothetical protein